MFLLVAAAMAATPDPKIINGEAASTDEFPAAGGMIMDFGMQGQSYRALMCSSTLIAPDTVLIAAHCLDEFALTYGFFELDEVSVNWSRQADLTAYANYELVALPDDAVPAWDWVLHPSWDMQSLQTGLSLNYDIALIFLDEPVTDVDFVYLPTAEEAAQLSEGLEVTVVGWGQQVATNGWEEPPAGSYGIKQQGVSHINELSDVEFQVGAVETDVRKCHGDSGGPSFAWLETESADNMRVIGVTSHAYDASDCNETGGVDTRVDYYLEWIDAEMTARCEDGSRAWCDEPGIPDPSLTEKEETEQEVVLEEEGFFASRGCSSVPGSASFGLMAGLLGLVALGRRRRQS